MSEVHKAARENMSRKGTAFDSAFHAAQQVCACVRVSVFRVFLFVFGFLFVVLACHAVFFWSAFLVV